MRNNTFSVYEGQSGDTLEITLVGDKPDSLPYVNFTKANDGYFYGSLMDGPLISFMKQLARRLGYEVRKKKP